ncbi:hypothetical protein HGRIS_006842 [Hohenbuehelia grisea]
MLDDSSFTTFNGTPDSSVQTQKTFYTSPTLQDGEHTLVVTCTVEHTFFWVDSLLVMPSIPSASASVDAQLPSSSATADSHSSSLPLPSDSSSPSPHRSSIPIGPIIGGVLGGLAVISAVFLLLLCRLRRRRQASPSTDTRVKPFPSVRPAVSVVSGNAGNSIATNDFSSQPSVRRISMPIVPVAIPPILDTRQNGAVIPIIKPLGMKRKGTSAQASGVGSISRTYPTNPSLSTRFHASSSRVSLTVDSSSSLVNVPTTRVDHPPPSYAQSLTPLVHPTVTRLGDLDPSLV